MAEKEGRKAGDMTARAFYADALYAGLTYTEARFLQPGFVREMALRRVEQEIEMNPLYRVFGGSGSKSGRKRP